MKLTMNDQIPAEFHRIEKSRLVSPTQLRDTISRLTLVNEIVVVECDLNTERKAKIACGTPKAKRGREFPQVGPIACGHWTTSGEKLAPWHLGR